MTLDYNILNETQKNALHRAWRLDRANGLGVDSSFAHWKTAEVLVSHGWLTTTSGRSYHFTQAGRIAYREALPKPTAPQPAPDGTRELDYSKLNSKQQAYISTAVTSGAVVSDPYNNDQIKALAKTGWIKETDVMFKYRLTTAGAEAYNAAMPLSIAQARFEQDMADEPQIAAYAKPAPDGIPAEKRSRFYVEAVTPPTLDYNKLSDAQRRAVNQAYIQGQIYWGSQPSPRSDVGRFLARTGWFESHPSQNDNSAGSYTLTDAGRDAYNAAHPVTPADTITPPVNAASIFEAVDSGRIEPHWVEWEKVARELWNERKPLLEVNGQLLHSEREIVQTVGKMALDSAYGAVVSELERENAELRAALVQIQQMTRSFIEANKAITQVSPTQAFWRIAHVEKIARAASETGAASEEAE